MKWVIVSALSVSCSIALADPVWHCSRTSQTAELSVSIQPQEDSFSIASFNASTDTIGVSISDLIDIYSGISVRIGGLPLSACFMTGNQTVTTTALTSLGLQPTVIQALARKSAIVQSNLHAVATNKQMMSCIAQNFPAVGYLEEALTTDEVQPCF
jgi:hypothetical protein